MLKVKNLSYLYASKVGVSSLSFELDQGEHLAVIGESGCGKSTLIKAIYGLFDLDEGSLYWNDEQILGPAYNLVPGFPKFKHLSQEFDLMPFTTAEDNIQKFLSRQESKQNQKRSDELIELFDLQEVKSQYVKTLSGGQKQRVALAQALAKPPELILLDEPFSHIDQFLKHRLRRRLFHFLKKERITCIFATHDAEDVLPFSDKTMVLKAGKAIDIRPTLQVYSQPKNLYCASLFGDVNVIKPQNFDWDSSDSQVLAYPHEIQILTEASFEALVKSVYFKGSHFLIELDYQGQSLFAISNHPTEQGNSVHFEIDKDAILKRLKAAN